MGLPDCEVREEMSRLVFKKISAKKGDRIMDRSNNSPKNHKYNKNKKQEN